MIRVARIDVALFALFSIAIGMIVAFAIQSTDEPLPACATEDSTNCVWDAERSGNGQGTSFVDLNGVVYVHVK